MVAELLRGVGLQHFGFDDLIEAQFQSVAVPCLGEQEFLPMACFEIDWPNYLDAQLAARLAPGQAQAHVSHNCGFVLAI
jgi:hypothetical protein